jgi:hypothetical protein
VKKIEKNKITEEKQKHEKKGRRERLRRSKQNKRGYREVNKQITFEETQRKLIEYEL